MGKATTESLIRPDLLVTSRIVLHLVKKLEQDYGSVEGFHVFTDRFYTSIELASALHEMKVHLTGTIMRNRKGLPIKIRSGKKGQKSKLKKGDIKAYRKEDKFSIIHWKDTNDVTVLSTLYNASVQTVRRIKKGGVIDNVTKPLSVCKYNESMGGVDLTDHYISSYPFIRKSLKWWRKVFFWLFETAIVNAYILYTKVSPQTKKIKQRVFRKRLVTQLVGEKRNNNKRKRPDSLEQDERLNGKLHVLMPLEGTKKKNCIVCSGHGDGSSRKRTKLVCDTCESKPGLCVGLCFQKYHTQKDFKN